MNFVKVAKAVRELSQSKDLSRRLRGRHNISRREKEAIAAGFSQVCVVGNVANAAPVEWS